MPGLVIVGAQWGDEGKGKLVDYLGAAADYVVRFQGGNNAGHTLVVNGQTFKLNLIPSGVLQPGAVCVIGAGVVVDPEVLHQEAERIRALGIDLSPKRLVIDEQAQLVLEYHRTMDGAQEDARGAGKIGTTRRGIGPAYVDRAARCGVRMADLVDLEELKPRLEQQVTQVNQQLEKVLNSSERVSFASVWEAVQRARERFLPHIGNASLLLDNALQSGKKVVFEGAQGTLLDQMHGSVPFVTSSHTLAGAVCTGCGIGPKRLDTILGVVKAYCTRVGSGPFPTELTDKTGDEIRARGHEYGTVTGRPRRCGWFDAVAMKRAVRLNGLDLMAITKLDVLGGLDTIRVCTGYRRNGVLLEDMPARLADYEGLELEYRDFPGWKEDLQGIDKISRLPKTAQEYLKALEEICGCPIALVSIGAERKATLIGKKAGGLKAFLPAQS